MMQASEMNLSTQQLLATHRAGVVRPTTEAVAAAKVNNAAGSADGSMFSKLLQDKIGNVRFSAHAATRMKSRNIDMTPEMAGKLQKAVDGAAAKGARDSLILLKDYAFIVNIPNRMVVTAMDGDNLKDNIFTNIDSAVVAD